MNMEVGRFARRAISFAVVAMLMLGALAAPTPSAAQTQTYESSLTGVSIAYDAPYQIFEDGVFTEDGMEILMFVGPADILSMGFMTPLIDLTSARDIMLETLFGEMGTAVTIDRGDYTGVSYSLDMLNMDGQEMGVFSLFMNQRPHGFAEFYIFLAPPTLFGSSMQTAQNSFSIDGNSLMDGVDPLVMGDMVTANIGTTGGEAVTNVTDVAEPENQGTDNTSETSTTTETTETTEPDTGAADAAGYVDSIQNHRLSFYESFGAFNTSLSGLDGEPTDAEIRAAFDGTLVEAEKWAGYSATAQQLTPPPGYEGVQEAYLAWAGHVTELGNIWIAALNGEDGQIDAFFDYIPNLEQAETDLDVAIADAEAQSTGGETEVDAGPSTDTTTDTTGTTVEDDTEETGDSSDTVTRTTRSTTTTEDETDSGTTTGRPDRSERTTRSTSSGDDEVGNTSETSGNTTETGTVDLPNEWVTEIHGVSITWSDDLILSTQTEEPQISDAATGEDEIWLQIDSGAAPIPVWVTVLENPGTDSTDLINAFVDDPAYAEDVWGAGTEVHDFNVMSDASAVLMQAEDEIGEYWVYVQVTCLDASCGTVALLEIATEGAPLVDALGVTETGLAVEGVNVSTALPATDVQDAVERFGN